MFTISKDFTFSASHQLAGLPEGHQCARLHGHNYVCRVEISSDHLDSTGFVVDYGELSPAGRWIDEHLDHRHLNDVLDFNPTAENLARYLAGFVATLELPGAVAVSVSETPKTWARWSA